MSCEVILLIFLYLTQIVTSGAVMTLDLALWLGLLPVSPPCGGMYSPHFLPGRMQTAVRNYKLGYYFWH